MSALDGASMSNVFHLFSSSHDESGKASTFPTPQVTRRHMLIHLKNCALKLMSFTHDNKQIDNSIPAAIDLCTSLEICFLYGIKTTEYNQSIPLWGVLERLECSTPPCIPLRNAVGAVASIMTLRSQLAKARGWIRQILNTKGGLDASLNALLVSNSSAIGSPTATSKIDFLGLFYYPHAIFFHKEDSSVMMAIIRSLRVISFNFKVDDETLNEIPAYLPSLLQLSNAVVSHPIVVGVRHNSISNTNDSPKVDAPQRRLTMGNNTGTPLEYFFGSLEAGLGNFMNNMDNATSTASKIIDNLNNPNSVKASTPFENVSSRKLLKSLSNRQKRLPLYGSNLRDLLTSEIWCFHSDLEPRLGVPSPILRLLHIIHQNIKTPNLFRIEVEQREIDILRQSFELGHGLNEHPPIHTACQMLIDYLNYLPEPLLGYDFYDAILACQEVEILSDRVRNLAILIRETPWYNRALLHKLLNLLYECCKTENAVHNGLNIVAVSVLTTPIFFRPPGRPPMGVSPIARDRYESWMMSATASGSGIVALLISQCQGVLGPLSEDLADIQAALTLKCQRLRRLQENCSKGYVASVLSDDAELQPLKDLFYLLKPIDIVLYDRIKSNEDRKEDGKEDEPNHALLLLESAGSFRYDPHSRDHDGQMTISDIISHQRWENCGFCKENPSKDFENNGLLGIHCLNAFLRKYPANAAEIALLIAPMTSKHPNKKPELSLSLSIIENDASPSSPSPSCRYHMISLGHLSTQLAKIITQVLHLVPHPDSSERPLPSLAKHREIWTMLNNPRAFQEVYDIGMLTFEDYWRCESQSFDPVSVFQSHRGDSLNELHHSFKLHNGQNKLSSVSDAISNDKEVEVNSNDGRGDDVLMQKFVNVLIQTQLSLETIMGLEKPESVDELWESWRNYRMNRFDSHKQHKKAMEIEKEKAMEKEKKAAEAMHDIHDGVYHQPSNTEATGDPITQLYDMHMQSEAFSSEVSSPSAAAATTSSTSSVTAADVVHETLSDEYYAKMNGDVMSHIIGGSTILSKEQLESIEKALPVTYQCKNWQNVYRLSRDGASMSTLVNKSKPASSSPFSSSTNSPSKKDNDMFSNLAYLLIIKDNHNNRFGGFICGTALGQSSERYHGSSDMAVFTFLDHLTNVQYYNATHRNNYYMLSSQDMMAFGGGGDFAIYLDGQLLSGSSGPCSTYDNPSLIQLKQPFTCIECELFMLESIVSSSSQSTESDTTNNIKDLL